VVVYGIDHQWQADLVDLAKLSSYNKGIKYLFVSGKEVHVVFLEKLLKYSVGKFSSFVRL
jgi:hypothetical protein